MDFEVEKVRLTPVEEAQRLAQVAERAALREERLKTKRYAEYIKLKAEFEKAPPDELHRLMTRVELEQRAKAGAGVLGENHVLSFAGLRDRAVRAINAMRQKFGWAFAKRWAISKGLAALLVIGGAFNVECVKADGTTRWKDILNLNGVTTAGLNYLLDAGFHAGSQVTVWYFGLVQGSSTPTYAAADTMSSHAGWTEYTAYSQTNRIAWDESAASSASTTSSTTSDFSMNATGTVAGAFVTSSSTKSGTSGTLWATGNFSGGNQAVGNGDTLKLTYTLNLTSS